MHIPSSVRSRFGRPRALALGLACALAPFTTVWAQTEAVYSYEIPAGSIAEQVNKIAEQAGLQVIYAEDTADLRKKGSAALGGQLSLSDALDRTLAGANLDYSVVNGDTIVVKNAPALESAPQTQPAPSVESAPEETNASENADEEPVEMRTLTVTGTSIRGVTTPSPTIELSAAEIKTQGFTDLGDVIRSLPQNFRGGENPGAVRVSSSLGRSENGNQAGGSALNLRGIGPGGSLTLLNGRRMSYGGAGQAVDITPIPVEAVQRLEIVTDGSSAIYGSDAIAGVGNVILRRDFDGVTLATEQGTATRGGLTTSNYSLTAGKVWSSGNLLFAYTDASRDAIFASERSYTKDHLMQPYTIFPEVNERAGLLSMNQAFGGHVDFEMDVLSSRRDQMLSAGYTSLAAVYLPHTKNELIAPTLTFWLPADWRVNINGSWGRNNNTQNLIDTIFETGESIEYSKYSFSNKIQMFQADAEGPLFSLGSEDARLAVGIGHRKNSYEYRHHLWPNTYGGDDSSKYGFAELYVPFVSPESNLPGIESLTLTAAIRSEDYSSFGRVNTPKLGISYSPDKNFSLKGTWGKSFKAPTLDERFSGRYGWIAWAVDDGYQGPDDGLVDMYITGGNAELGPERARAWTATLSFHPEAVPGLKVDLTGFDIDYTDRIVDPIPNSQFALSNPFYNDFILLHPTLDQYEHAASELLEIDNWYEIEYSPDNLYAIIFGHLVNAERQRIRGIDLSGSQSIEMKRGILHLNGTISWLDSTQTTLPGQDSERLSGTIYNPAKRTARLGASWTTGGFSAAGYVNHTGGVVDNYWRQDEIQLRLPSFNTVDLTFRYSPPTESGFLQGTAVSFFVRNVLDKSPALFDPPSVYVLPYDATNSSPIGRYVGMTLSKTWE